MNLDYPVDKRNQQLLLVFQKLGYNCKIVGDPNQPKVIIDDRFALSGWTQNRLYHFTTKPFFGKTVKTIDIYKTDITRADVDELIDNCDKRRIWLLVMSSSNLFYVDTKERKPYFSNVDKHFFFDKDKAIDIQKFLEKSHNITCILHDAETL